MSNLTSSIFLGISLFPLLAVLITVPLFLTQLLCHRKFNFMKIAMNYGFLLYALCLIALVFFPLPTPEQAAHLTYRIQVIPFHFIVDIMRETPFVLSNPMTYLPALMHRTVLQVAFNVLMTIPFGMYLRYYYKCSGTTIFFCSFALTCFIEFGQLTGLFFIYSGSYRLCDVDDLICNTLGGCIGSCIVALFEKWFPSIEDFDLPLPAFLPQARIAK